MKQVVSSSPAMAFAGEFSEGAFMVGAAWGPSVWRGCVRHDCYKLGVWVGAAFRVLEKTRMAPGRVTVPRSEEMMMFRLSVMMCRCPAFVPFLAVTNVVLLVVVVAATMGKESVEDW
ncbi:hypothetical protein PIB30_009608, partial [Stylosanthes scabra]|nr:hypothetical protein [Stylosanthes scabra]